MLGSYFISSLAFWRTTLILVIVLVIWSEILFWWIHWEWWFWRYQKHACNSSGIFMRCGPTPNNMPNCKTLAPWAWFFSLLCLLSYMFIYAVDYFESFIAVSWSLLCGVFEVEFSLAQLLEFCTRLSEICQKFMSDSLQQH